MTTARRRIAALFALVAAAGCSSTPTGGASNDAAGGLRGSPSSTAAIGISTPSLGIESPPSSPGPPTECADGTVDLAWDPQQGSTRLCVVVGAQLHVRLSTYPSGWSPVTIAPKGAAEVTRDRGFADGSADVVIATGKVGSFTASTYTLDDLAPSVSWTIDVAVREPDATATLTGVVRGYGGPAVLVGGSPRQALNGDPMPHQAVVATDTAGHTFDTTSDAQGRYVLYLVPGTYTIAGCGQPASVGLAANRVTSLDEACPVP
jgi:hypothetical protein